jgi:integrase
MSAAGWEMAETVRVHVVDYGRKSLYMRYVDPLTGKQVVRSTGTINRRDAERVAAKWEAELQEGRYLRPSKIAWCDFRARYEAEVLPGLAKRTEEKVWSVFNSIDGVVSPQRVADLTADRISQWQNVLRQRGLAEATIKGHSAHLKAALRWAHAVGLLTAVPTIRMPKRAKGGKVMKGRPITTEEFERMLAAVPKVIGDKQAEHWRLLLRGLWWSGLRLGEATALKWNGHGLSVDMAGRRPMFRIPAESEKGNQNRILPMAPEFADMLHAVPIENRVGFVFSTPLARHETRRIDTISKTIVNFGTTAGVKVDVGVRAGKPSLKYASAHDLRRAFGLRWSTRVMPPILQQLMRHESIETTLRYYVGRDAEATADVLWEAVAGNTSGNSRTLSNPQQVENPVN